MAILTAFKRASGAAASIENQLNARLKRRRSSFPDYRPVQRSLYYAMPNGKAMQVIGGGISESTSTLEMDDIQCSYAAGKWSCWAVITERECDCESEEYFFEYSDDNPETIDQAGSITITLDGGCPPYAWTVSGNSGGGFTLANEETFEDTEVGEIFKVNKTSNILYANSTVTGAATITVTDECGIKVVGDVRCTTGYWEVITYVTYGFGGGYGCGIVGCPSDYRVVGRYMDYAAYIKVCGPPVNLSCDCNTWGFVFSCAGECPPVMSPSYEISGPCAEGGSPPVACACGPLLVRFGPSYMIYEWK